MSTGQGYHVEPDLLEARITTLTKLGELTGDLVATASRLAERQPMLGTAPPAVAVAKRLRAAAGQSGLAGEVSAAKREVQAFQEMLSDAKATYTERDADVESAVRTSGERDGAPGSHGAHERITKQSPGRAVS